MRMGEVEVEFGAAVFISMYGADGYFVIIVHVSIPGSNGGGRLDFRQ